MERDFLRGRRLILEEIPESYRPMLTEQNVQKLPTMIVSDGHVTCLRCGSLHDKKVVGIKNVGGSFLFCPTCITLGRIQSNQYFYTVADEKKFEKNNVFFSWQGKLTEAQGKASAEVAHAMKQNEEHLIHAVTGAGKTEMLFHGIYQSLTEGKRVVVASPRVDVCLELYPRFVAAFQNISIALLHGKQTERYRSSQLVIATTHQLLRFYHAFDVVIVDEVDAFPFANNKMLYYGVAQARKEISALIFVTATPSKELLKRQKANAISVSKVSNRYHGHPLPVPKTIWQGKWEEDVNKGKIPVQLKFIVQKQLQNSRRTLVFCPHIKWMDKLTKLLQEDFPTFCILSASAKDATRYEKVEAMRNEQIDILLTSTILERGVTFSDIDVVVIGSNHDVFTKSALIQIAGRVGRKKEYPEGQVLFIHDGWSKAMKHAIKDIQVSNYLATRRD